MDSNRRHQLAQNDLANWFFKQYDEWIRPNSHWLGLLAFGVLLLIVLTIVSSRVVRWNTAAAWRQYYTAIDSPDATLSLAALADASNSEIGLQARLSLGNILLGEACNDAFVDKKAAQEKLDKATLHFQKVRDAARNVEMRQQATWGLAQAYEAYSVTRTDKNDLEAAIAEYKMLAETWPNDYLGIRAAEVLAFLSKPETKNFFEMVAATTEDKPTEDDFKVDIDIKDPFTGGPSGFDPQNILGNQ